jgi:acyl-CoA synthetase (NDP forming)
MTTETTLATLPKEKSVEQNSTQTTVEDIKQVTQSNTAQDKSLEAKQLKEKVPVSKPEAKTVTKPAKANHPKAEFKKQLKLR